MVKLESSAWQISIHRRCYNNIIFHFRQINTVITIMLMTEHHHYHPPLTARIDYCSPDVHVNYNNYIHEIQDIQSQLKIFIRFNQHI